MKKHFFNIKSISLLMALISLGSCADDDIAQIGDLVDTTGPTPTFDFQEITESEFDCLEVLQFADYEVSLEAASNLAVNGVGFEWDVTEITGIDAETAERTLSPIDGLTLINSETISLENQLGVLRADIDDIEDEIRDLELALPCLETQDEIDASNAEIAALEVSLADTMAGLDEETAASILSLENQIASLPAGLATDKNVIAGLPGPGLYNFRLTVTDNLGASNFIDQEVTILEAVATIPTPEIVSFSFENTEDNPDGRDAWRTPSNAAWSPTTGGTTVIQINTSSTVPDGERAAKFPRGGDRTAYQEIEVTPGATYTLFYFQEFVETEVADLTVTILRPNTASYAESLLEENVLARRTDDNEGRSANAFVQSALSFDAEEHETVIIYVTTTGGESRLDNMTILVNQ